MSPYIYMCVSLCWGANPLLTPDLNPLYPLIPFRLCFRFTRRCEWRRRRGPSISMYLCIYVSVDLAIHQG